MLPAFLRYKQHGPAAEAEVLKDLYTIDHAGLGPPVIKLTLPNGGSLRSLPCNAENCRRCMNLQGGYQFRWYDARWADLYNRMKREGAATLPLA